MSELIISRGNHTTIRWKLMTSASALTLASCVSYAALAADGGSSGPVMWLELGGQLQFLANSSETWIPANLPPVIDHPITEILSQKPRFGYDAEGRISLQPQGSDWSFSASVQYGRAKRGPRFAHDQTYKSQLTPANHDKYVRTTYAFADMHSAVEASHAIIDFQAGKDVGLGLFGRGGSVINFGIRTAQFREKAIGHMTAQTNVPDKYHRGTLLDASMDAARSFSGIGPSLTWNGSAPVTGSLEDGLAIDWGVNSALLFGRQKVKIRTHSEDRYYTGGVSYYYTSGGGVSGHYLTAVRTNVTREFDRRKTVIVPNVGAFAGISYRVGGRGKIALGYRADFFFNAMDGGIDTHKSENVGFHGPFATISLGLGG